SAYTRAISSMLPYSPSSAPVWAPAGARAEKSTSLRASSIRRLWSSASRVLRVTFSVASTVRSATSLRIRSSERLVSSSMSRRAAETSSSRFSRPAAAASASAASAALRARATMSSACSRASFSRSRYSASSRSASARCFSAASMLSRIALARFSSASPIRGSAKRESTNRVSPNAISVQIISPSAGETRKLPLEDASGISAAIWGVLEEERDQPEDERVEGDGLGQREAEPADRLQLVLHLGLARHGLDLLAEDDADAHAGSDRAEAGPDAERDRLAGVGDPGVGDAARRRNGVNHELAPSFLASVTRGGRASEVDSGEDGEDECLQGGDQHHL